MRNFKKAIADFDEAILLEPINPRYFHAKGLSYQTEAECTQNKKEQKSLRKNSIDNYQLALDQDPNFKASLFHIGLVSRYVGHYKEAL